MKDLPKKARQPKGINMQEQLGVVGLKADGLPILGQISLAIPRTIDNKDGFLSTVVTEVDGDITLWADQKVSGLSSELYPCLTYKGGLNPARDFKALQKYDGWATKERRACISRHDGYVSDCQKDHLYSWEINVFPEPTLIEVVEAKELVTYAARFTNLKEIALNIVDRDCRNPSSLGKVALRRVSRFGVLHSCEITLIYYDYGSLKVAAYAVLHEIAHVIDYCRFRGPGHGPTFCSIYASLLHSSGLLPDAIRSMNLTGLIAAK